MYAVSVNWCSNEPLHDVGERCRKMMGHLIGAMRRM